MDLLFSYLDKRPDEVPYVLHLLTDQFEFKDNSYLRGYMIQREVIDLLWNRTLGGSDELYSKLFISVAEKCLHIRFHTIEWKGHRTFSSINFQLAPTPKLFELRQAIWSGLFQLYKTSLLREWVLGLLYNYSTFAYSDSVNEVIAQDASEILAFIESELDPKSYRHCFIVHRYLDLLEHCEVPFDPNLRNQFTNEAYDLSKILLSKWSEMRGLDLGSAEYEQFKKEQIKEYFKSFSFDEYVQFFKICSEILDDIDSVDEFRLQSSVEDVMLELSKRDPDLYIEVMKFYIDLGDPFHLNSMSLVKSLVDICGVERTCEILTLPDYPTKRVWLIDYYLTLPESEVTDERLSRLYYLYKEAQLTEFRRNYDLLLKYRSIDKDVVAKVTEITLEKSKDNCGSIYPLMMMFNTHTEVNKEITDIFSNHLNLIKRVYFAVLKNHSYFDHDGQTFSRILDVDPDFILDYVNFIHDEGKLTLPQKYIDDTFLWMREDFEKLMIRVADQIYNLVQKRSMILYTCLDNFFVDTDSEKNIEVEKRQDSFLKGLIERRHDEPKFMTFIFGVIAQLSPERRLKFLEILLEYNNDFELFRRIPLEPNIWSGVGGSFVPAFQKRAEYFESLLPLLNTVELLEHKQYVERIIQEIYSDIEQEKKRNFMED